MISRLTKQCTIVLVTSFILSVAVSSMAGFSLFPEEDREINRFFYGSFDTVLLNDGQWWPKVRFVSSPEEEMQIVMRYDLGSYQNVSFSRARLKFYLKEAWHYNAIDLQIWFYEGDGGIVSSDFDQGTGLAGTFQWEAPLENVEVNQISRYVEFDVTDLLNSRENDQVNFIIRLAGGYPDYEGNVFGITGSSHNIFLGAVENHPYSPSLEITPECIANIDGDSDVDGQDLAVFAQQYGQDCSPSEPCSADFNDDNIVDFKDLSDIAVDFGKNDCPASGYFIKGHVLATNISRPGPLPGVRVLVDDIETTTDSDGYFELTGIPTPEFRLLVDGWNYTKGVYSQIHFDFLIPEEETGINNFTVHLPLIGPASKTVIDTEIADIIVAPDGSTSAQLKTSLDLIATADGKNATLTFAKGSVLTFPPGVEPSLAMAYLGLNAMPVPLPVDSDSKETLYTTNLFSIQPEGVLFSESPVLLFKDHDGFEIGISYELYHYGSWHENTPLIPPTKDTDGFIVVPSGITESGTFAMPPNPLEILPSNWKLTNLTGRVVLEAENSTYSPVPGAEVTGGINGGFSGADGRFSFNVLSKIPGNPELLLVVAHAFATIDDEVYTGLSSRSISTPDGTTDVGDVVLSKMMWLTEVVPESGITNVEPANIVSSEASDGVKFTFNKIISSVTDADGVSIVRMPLLHSLYEQKLLTIPGSWGEFDPEMYDCNGTNITTTLLCQPPGCNEQTTDQVCLQKCQDTCSDEYATCLKENPDYCTGDCAGDPNPGCYDDCIAYELNECQNVKSACSLECLDCDSVCVDCPDDESNTVVFNMGNCTDMQGNLYNQWWFFMMDQLEEGILGDEGEVLFDPYLTMDMGAAMPGFDKTKLALYNYLGGAPPFFLMFATKEDPDKKKSPLLGLLIPSDTDSSGFEWHDYDTLSSNTTLEIESGTILRIQAEDQTFMKRIVAHLGEETFIQTISDENEKGFLMHLNIPFPESGQSEPILLSVFAEGVAHELLKDQNLDGHKTNFQVYLRPKSDGPTIEQIQPSLGLFAGDAVILHIYGTDLNNIQNVSIFDPDGVETKVDFSIQDSTHIFLDTTYVFVSEGIFRLVITDPNGEAEKNISVQNQSGIVGWSMWADSNSHYYDPDISLDNYGETPSPYLGKSQVSVESNLSDIDSARLDAVLLTDSGITYRDPVIPVMQLNDTIQGRAQSNAGVLVGRNKLCFREVVNLYGVELADGTTSIEGTIPCHLEMTGTASRDPWINTGWVMLKYYYGVGVIPPGTSLSDDPCYFMSAEAPEPLGTVGLGYLLSLDNTWEAGSTSISVVSDSFQLPVTGALAFYPTISDSRLEWRCELDTSYRQAAVNFDLKLVCDDPGLKLIYRK